MLLKKKIIASSIENLTDARYFAGWMVDYMIFNIDPNHEFYTNPQEIGSFQSWVSGPEYILEMSSDQYEHCERYLVELNCQYVLIDFSQRSLLDAINVPKIYRITWTEYLENKDLVHSLGSSIVLYQLEDFENQITLLENNVDFDIYLEMPDQTLSSEILLRKNLDGFMVHGSPEEKVGFKSFDELDEIFEILQDF